jgi:glucuronate isomerase
MHHSIKPFLDENFLLDNRIAEILFHEYAKTLPIIDYHNHLAPDEVTNNKQFKNISEAWLYGDHYKWRAMRALGIPEEFVTGKASDWEKFQKWAETVPYTIRNPLFHWTHLELQRYFNINQRLSGETAEGIYQECNHLLHSGEYGAKDLLLRMNVELVCTTDDPVDTLEHHLHFKNQKQDLKLLPAFRPDIAIQIENNGFLDYIKKIGKSANLNINKFDDLLQALKIRLDYFHENGCRLSDHGLEKICSEDFTTMELDRILDKRASDTSLNPSEINTYKSAVIYHLGVMYAEKGWVQQFHLGALRNNNQRMLKQLGPDSGFDSIGDFSQAAALAAFLDRLDKDNKLAKTIIYNLNPADNEVIATMIGNFNDGSVRGKMQFGAAWWFLDQQDGMEKQLNALSNMGLISCFIGMLTDSRSFLSFPRHEYFRRLLCNMIGRDVHDGKLPNDTAWLGNIISDICYGNAKRYFNF